MTQTNNKRLIYDRHMYSTCNMYGNHYYNYSCIKHGTATAINLSFTVIKMPIIIFR